MLYFILIIILVWTGLTLWVEAEGPERNWQSGNDTKGRKALIVFDPDPIYNLDEQVCQAFARVLADNGWFVQTFTVKAAKKKLLTDYDLYLFCANTYNWAPDWAITRYIKKHLDITGKKTISITLGSGSTKRAKRIFENTILDKGGHMADSRTFWLLRPNDESRIKEKNVIVALSEVEEWAKGLISK